MALGLNYSAVLLKAQMDAITTRLGNGALVRIYDGSQPANPDTAVSGPTLLAELTCATPFASGASSAIPSVLTVGTVTQDSSANAGGTPTWFRALRAADSGGTVGEIDGTVGQTGTPGVNYDMVCGVITVSQPVAITSWTITSGT